MYLGNLQLFERRTILNLDGAFYYAGKNYVFTKNGLALKLDSQEKIESIDILLAGYSIKGLYCKIHSPSTRYERLLEINLSDILSVIPATNEGVAYNVIFTFKYPSGEVIATPPEELIVMLGLPVTASNVPFKRNIGAYSDSPFDVAPPDTIQLRVGRIFGDRINLQTSALFRNGAEPILDYRNTYEILTFGKRNLEYFYGQFSGQILLRPVEDCYSYCNVTFVTPFGGRVSTGWRIESFKDKIGKDIDLADVSSYKYLRRSVKCVSIVMDNVTNRDISYYSNIMLAEKVYVSFGDYYDQGEDLNERNPVKVVSNDITVPASAGSRTGKLKFTLQIIETNY